MLGKAQCRHSVSSGASWHAVVFNRTELLGVSKWELQLRPASSFVLASSLRLVALKQIVFLGSFWVVQFDVVHTLEVG